MVRFFVFAVLEPRDVRGPEKGIVRSTRVSQFCTSSDDNSESISNVIGILSRKQYYMTLYSRFYKENIWREKQQQIKQLPLLQMADKSTRHTHCFCKIIPGKLLKLQLWK